MQQGAYLLAAISLFLSCNTEEKKVENTPIRGTVRISADATVKPLIVELTQTFTQLYPETNFELNFTTEAEAIDEFIQQKSTLAFSARALTSEELDVFNQIGFKPAQLPIAVDAVAIITSRPVTDLDLKFDNLVKVISGKISLWSELIPGEAADSITLLFDHANSSITRFILDSLSENGKFPASSFASGSQEKLFDYLSENPSAIGFTGVNWLMHPHPDWKTKLEKVSILGLSSIQPDDSVIYYQPFLTYETQPHYPLSRHLFLLSRETYIGLGTAFATFVASDKGQTVVRRAGMLPARQPLRIIELKSDFE